jgi:hypothetical protein
MVEGGGGEGKKWLYFCMACTHTMYTGRTLKDIKKNMKRTGGSKSVGVGYEGDGGWGAF